MVRKDSQQKQTKQANQVEQTYQEEQANQMKQINQEEQANQIEQINQTEQIVHRIEKSKEEYMFVNIPEEGPIRMKAAIEQAKEEKGRQKRRQYRWRCAGGFAAAFVIIFLMPNCSEASAQALQKLPVIGRFFEVITIRDYQFDDGYSSADVKVPALSDRNPNNTEDENAALADINQSVEEYTNDILERFKENQKILGDQGHQSLDISYEVLTNTDRWFTLEITVNEVQGSGFQYKRYYHIDKSTGKIASLKDLFEPGSNYLKIISDSIQKQMEEYNENSEDGDVYWIGNSEFVDGYEGITEDQNFYLNKQNHLIIIFDEYEVAPGYMGMPRFKIPQELIEDIRKF